MTKGLALGLAGLVLVAACGLGPSRSQAAQQADAEVLSTAIASADREGRSFTMGLTLTFMGGNIPAGQQERIQARILNGLLKDDRARFDYRLLGRPAFDAVVAQGQFYLKPHSDARWRTVPFEVVVGLVPLVRLELLREAVLLARSVGGATVTLQGLGLARRYAVQPAVEQLAQFLGVSGDLSGLEKLVSGELDVFLSLTSRQLLRVELRADLKQPDGSEARTEGWMELRPARVGAIAQPQPAVSVTPDQLFT